MAKENNNNEDGKKFRISPPPEESKRHRSGAPEWMCTYSDMVTLLLCIFVLLFAMSTTQHESYKKLVESLRNALGEQMVPETGVREGLLMHAVPTEEPSENRRIDELGNLIEKEMEEIVSEVRELVLLNKLGGEVSVTKNEEGVIITLSDLLLFPEGGAHLSEKGHDILEKVAVLLSKLAYFVEIKGHTDSSPISSSLYPSNWELSSARASMVARLLVDNGVAPHYVSAEGYAHYHPVATNDTAKGRALNRRVEIVYERDSIARQFSGMDVGEIKKNGATD